jgi:hypothetical protein
MNKVKAGYEITFTTVTPFDEYTLNVSERKVFIHIFV